MPTVPSVSQSLSTPSCRLYRLVAFLRVEPDNPEPLTYQEALAEQEQQELLFPENIYRIEEVSHDAGD